MESLVPLFTNTSTQWRTAIHATVAVSRFRRSLFHSARQQGLGGLEHLQPEIQTQNGSRREHDDTHSQASHSEEANQAAQIDPQALDRKLEDKNPEVEVVKLIRDELVKQLDAYGIVLVLLAGITFLAILQPPGSFDKGKLQESLLVSLFMLLATLSFFIACTGLGAVMVGCAELFRPFFYTKLAKYTDVSNSETGCLPVENSPTTETPARQGFRKWLLGCCEVGSNYVAVDDINVLADLCIENVYRIRRIRFYLGVALVLCIAAYICGALAVMVTNDRQRYMLILAMGVGSVILIYEICITLSAVMKPVAKSIDRSQQPKLHQQLNMYTNRYDEEQPHIQAQPRNCSSTSIIIWLLDDIESLLEDVNGNKFSSNFLHRHSGEAPYKLPSLFQNFGRLCPSALVNKELEPLNSWTLVDDKVAMCKDKQLLNKVTSHLKMTLKVTVGNLVMNMGIHINRDRFWQMLYIDQESYTETILWMYKFLKDASPVLTPCDPHVHLSYLRKDDNEINPPVFYIKKL